MKLAELMVREVIQASAGESVAVAARRMREKAVGCLVITAGGVVKGIITDGDLLDCLAQGHAPDRCQIAAHMRRPVIVLRPEEDHLTAAEVMGAKRIKRLPIASHGKLLGIVSLSDLAAFAAAEAARLHGALNILTAILGTQSARHEVATGVEKSSSVDSRAELTNNNSRQAMTDNGGPG